MKKPFLWVVFIVAILFAWGLQQLFVLRFASGDVYPAYSSLRADPLGVKALWESLDHHLEVHRLYQPLTKLGPGRDTTLFHVGSTAENLRFSQDEFRMLEAFLLDGGRVVFTVYPTYRSPRVNPFLAGKGGPSKTPRERATLSIADQWGLKFGYVTLTKDPKGVFEPVPAEVQGQANLPSLLSCHTSLVFTNPSPAWSVIYARPTNLPVVVERQFGAGTIVLSADSYHLSNEALIADRHPSFLSWLVGNSSRVIFDETHLGVQETPGIATLARKYRLQGLVTALAVLAGLFIWKNSLSFMPPYDAQTWRDRRAWVAGKDASTGFINLLSRNIPRDQLMKVCLEQWIAHSPRRAPVNQDKLRQMQRLIDEENARPPRQRDPVKLYQAFARLLAQKNFRAATKPTPASEAFPSSGSLPPANHHTQQT